MPLSILLNVYIVQRVQRLPSQSSDQEEDDHYVYRNLLFEVIHYAKRIDFCLPVTFSRVARRYMQHNSHVIRWCIQLFCETHVAKMFLQIFASNWDLFFETWVSTQNYVAVFNFRDVSMYIQAKWFFEQASLFGKLTMHECYFLIYKNICRYFIYLFTTAMITSDDKHKKNC